MPANEALLRLLRETGPLASTSANTEGAAPASTAEEIERLFGDRVAWIVGEMCTAGGRPSTVVDASARPARILRSGAGDTAAARFMQDLEGYPTGL
jgi:tRNA A37 threonylcarbamoyladenosine synthetase subunit TsaC/SUA5/YrdC